ncbi:HlyC/CorC family transporter, partial [Lacticaseibacillus paracasei]|nr:HlyC/CorC family transporter [Lacticaseibacillus paracasei]
PSSHHSEKMQLAPGVLLATGKVEGSRLVNVHVHLSSEPVPEEASHEADS